MSNKPIKVPLITFLLTMFLIVTYLSPTAANLAQATATISGTITGPGGVPVDNVEINAWTPTSGSVDVTTNANGEYSFVISSGEVELSIRPPIDDRLAQKNMVITCQQSACTHNFELVAGHLVAGTVKFPNGSPMDDGVWVNFNASQSIIRNQGWLGDILQNGGQFQAVVPPSYYLLEINPPAPYFNTMKAVDVRTSDVTNVVITVNDEYVHPYAYDPPVLEKITVGAPNELGEATISGTSGTVLPLVNVLLINLKTGHQAHTVSESDGSFSSQIFAPPGSSIMVKHGPFGWRWNELEMGVSEMINPFPGTIINIAHTHSAANHEIPFAATGSVNVYAGDGGVTRSYVDASWTMTGALGPIVVDGQWSRQMSGLYGGQNRPGLYSGGMNWTHPAFVDLDNDNDLDLLVGESSGQLTLYRNRGTAVTPNWKFETNTYATINTGYWAYPALVDVTGDNTPDMFIGTGNGQVLIYYNTGTPNSPSWPNTPDTSLATGNEASPTLFDLDNDNDLDLLVGHNGGTLYHFENTGSSTNPVWTFRTDKYGGINETDQSIQPSFVNLDGDSDQDLLIGRCGDLVWYRNNGPVTNPSWTRITDGYGSIGGSCAVSPGLGDWDNDNDLDLLIGHHWGNFHFYRNDGPPNWVEQNIKLPFDLTGDTAAALGDWDNDNDLDLLIGAAGGDVYQYTNVGDNTTPDWQDEGVLLSLPWTDHPHAFPALADIDGDNKPELFIGEGGWQGPNAGGNIHYYDNVGTTSVPNWSLVTTDWLGIDVGGWSTPTFVDINNDNDLDMFIGAEDGTVTFVENTGSPTSPSWATPVSSYAGLDMGDYSAPAFIDVDNDGDLDMLIGLKHGSLAYVRNTGTISNPAWELVSTQYPAVQVGERAVPTAADINGDGDQDLMVGEGDGGVNLYLYEGPGTPAQGDVVYQPGDLFQVKGTFQILSPGISASTDVNAISVHGHVQLMMLSDQNGQPLPARPSFMSTILTPTGFPIQRSQRSTIGIDNSVKIDELQYAGGHTITADVTISGIIPDDAPAGQYRPIVSLGFENIPDDSTWLAANVTSHYTFSHNEAPLPPITVGDADPLRLNWQLLMDDFVQGTRGIGAREDAGKFALASEIVSQGAPFYIPPINAETGQAIDYRLEPYLPMISFTDRRMPAPPLIPFDLPGGELCVSIQNPDSSQRNLGCESFAQSFNRTKTTADGNDLNSGTVQLDDVYSLQGVSDRFVVNFDQYGHHIVTMTGEVDDLWGNTYSGGGTYDVWVAQPLDIAPGVLPGTPLAVNDAFNPSMQFYPRVPAEVTLTITHYPDSDPAQKQTFTRTGAANKFGYFDGAGSSISLTEPGEYRVDVTAVYTTPDNTLYMGTMTWGSIVMTPSGQAELIAHGRRGMDNLEYIPNHWFVVNRDLTIPEGSTAHILNPYFNGDIVWSKADVEAQFGTSLVMGASVQDTVGTIEANVLPRLNRTGHYLYAPGDANERFAKGEIPLFTSTHSGMPAQIVPEDVDQVAYSYRSSQRPGVRVREMVAEDGESGGYWRLNTLYDDQLGVGTLGDQPNDFKFQYVGAVYRDLLTDHNEYVGQGTGWVFIPDDDPLGNRVMPPFAGPGNGGWTTEGGPILTLKGEDIHLFILPTGTRPGAVLQVGDTFSFAGHVMPTLDSKVNVTVTAPSGATHQVSGQANSIGYFYNSDDDFIVNEPGLWSVDVNVWHDGQCSGGSTIPPYPSGDVLGSENGRYWFYVTPPSASRLGVSTPSSGFLSIDGQQVDPIQITGPVPSDITGATIDYTIMMPGTILQHGQVTPSNGAYQITFDPATLHNDFPNLDLIGRSSWEAGLSDTFIIGIMLKGQQGNQTVYQANTITIQGEQVFIGEASADKASDDEHAIYLPMIVK